MLCPDKFLLFMQSMIPTKKWTSHSQDEIFHIKQPKQENYSLTFSEAYLNLDKSS